MELGIYPAVDPLESTSRILDPLILGEDHYNTARGVQEVLQKYKDGKHFDRQFLVAAQGESRGIHDAQVFRHGLVKAQARVARGLGVFAGIGGINAIHLGGLEH